MVEKRQKEIEKIYPEAKGALIDSKVYRWNKNPWLLGGFTKRHQRIYFAGEHTDNLLPGFMEGAIRSRQSVVEQLADK